MHVQGQAEAYMPVHFSMTLVFSQRPWFPDIGRFWWQGQQDDDPVVMPFLPICNLSPKSILMKSYSFSCRHFLQYWNVRQTLLYVDPLSHLHGVRRGGAVEAGASNRGEYPASTTRSSSSPCAVTPCRTRLLCVHPLLAVHTHETREKRSPSAGTASRANSILLLHYYSTTTLINDGRCSYFICIPSPWDSSMTKS